MTVAMRVRRLRQRRARIEIIPLIDVTFLLLVFFIYLSLSMTIHKGIRLRLPMAETVKRDRTEAVEVSVDREGRVFLDQSQVAMEDLQEAIRGRVASLGVDQVTLRGDKDVAYEQIMDVLDRIRQAGVGKVSLEAQGKER
jgi:biopolymer transport protein ExbD